MKDVILILGGMAAVVVGLTLLGGGNFELGTGRSGPFASFGYTGPYR